MNSSGKTFLETEACLVTADEVVVHGHRYPMQKVRDARMVLESSYQMKMVPFVFAMIFVVWTLSELVNGTDDYAYALVAGMLAVLSMVAVRLVGRLQKQAAWLTLPEGPVVVFRSSDSAAVSELVKAVNRARAYRQPQPARAWGVASPVKG